MAYDFEANGNIILYGGTSTGKTIFQKYLTQLYIKEGKYTIDDVYIFTTNRYQWESYNQENIFEEWGENVKVIKNKVVKGSKRGLLLFDDFNNEINVNYDKQYNDLMTRSRHYGIKIITLGHTPTSVGKATRESALYAITGFSSNVDFIKEMSKYYYSNQNHLLLKLLREASTMGKYTMLVINKRDGTTFFDKADLSIAEPEKQFSISDENRGTRDLVKSFKSDEDKVSSFSSCNPSSENRQHGIGNAGVIANRNNYGLDQSHNYNNYHIDNKIAIQQRYEDNRVNNELKLINYNANKKLEIIKQKDELKDLCFRPFKEEDDINRQIFLLNRLCSVSCVNRNNINKWSKVFLEHNFPEVKFNPDSNFKKISNNYGLIKAGIKGDIKSAAPTLLGMISETDFVRGLSVCSLFCQK